VGGPETPGVGFAGGIERALLVLGEQGAQAEADRRLDAFVAVAEPDASIPAVQLLHRLRKAGVRADRDYQQKGLKAQFKLADRYRARFVLILGSAELESGVVSVKDLDSGEQVSVPDSDIVEYIQARVRRA
jgi:histidyl-tRNA synthetase